MQLPKNVTKCLLFIIIHIFSIYSFYNQPVLFAQLENVNKLWNNNRTEHVNERNQNKNKTKSRHIQTDHALYYSILSEKNVMVSLKDGFTAWSQSQKEDFLSTKYSLAQHDGVNPIFFSKKNKDWTSRTLVNLVTPYV